MDVDSDVLGIYWSDSLFESLPGLHSHEHGTEIVAHDNNMGIEWNQITGRNNTSLQNIYSCKRFSGD